MTDEPSATEYEQEQGPDRLEEEEDMRGSNEPDSDLPGKGESE